MTWVNALPLVIAALVLAPLVIARVHDGVDRFLTHLSLRVFGEHVEQFKDEQSQRVAALHGAQIPTTYRVYGARTMLFATVFAIVGSILGIYVIWGVLWILAIDPTVLREVLPSTLHPLAEVVGEPRLTIAQLFALMLLSCLTVGVNAGAGAYWLRWWYPFYVANTRARRIDAALPGTVAFIYALSRSGMEFPTVIRIVAANEDTYGETTREFDVAVRNMDTFGMDVITALQMMGRRTPSGTFKEFTENLVSVLQSGRSLSAFLEQQYHVYRDEAESQQESMLELLGTLAEAYVTVLVAGPLFLITILVVIGFSIADTLSQLQALVYLVLPAGNLLFVVYLTMVTDAINPGRPSGTPPDPPELLVTERLASADVSVTDPGSGVGAGATVGSADATSGTTSLEGIDRYHIDDGSEPNRERLTIYRRLRSLQRTVGRPVQTILDRPRAILWITLPVAALALLWHVPSAIFGGSLDTATLENVIAATAVFVVGTFAIAYEVHRRRLETIEATVPDLLDRLASVNEAGMPMIAAIEHVRGSDLGVLDEEIDRVWADVTWGGDLETALRRFESRVRSRTISRVVTLLTESMNASGDLASVLRIAARQASIDRRLKRERRQAMIEYMVVVYVSFLVFLFIIAILSTYLLPALPTEEAVDVGTGATAADVEGLGGIADVDVAGYESLFYHATLIQAAFSGFIAGQLSTGDVRAGAKHATVMLVVALVAFALIL